MKLESRDGRYKKQNRLHTEAKEDRVDGHAVDAEEGGGDHVAADHDDLMERKEVSTLGQTDNTGFLNQGEDHIQLNPAMSNSVISNSPLSRTE